MSIAQVVNHGKKFDCGCANKWEWLSVNGSQIGLVCLRREKPLGHSNSVYMCGFQNKQKTKKLLHNPKRWHTPQYEGHGFKTVYRPILRVKN